MSNMYAYMSIRNVKKRFRWKLFDFMEESYWNISIFFTLLSKEISMPM